MDFFPSVETEEDFFPSLQRAASEIFPLHEGPEMGFSRLYFETVDFIIDSFESLISGSDRIG